MSSNRLWKYARLIDFDSGVPGNPFIPGDPGWDQVVNETATVFTGYEVAWTYPASSGTYTMVPGDPQWQSWDEAFDHGATTFEPPDEPITYTWDYDAGTAYNATFGKGTISYVIHHEGYDPIEAVDHVPPSYTYGPPGWTGGARSIGSLTGAGLYQFTIPTNVDGVITGLNDVNSDAGYININYAIEFSSPGNLFRVMENGAPRTELDLFRDTDVFTIARDSAGVVRYYQNSKQLYVSGVRSTGEVFADASLWAGGDSIIDAVLSESVDALAEFSGDAIEAAIFCDVLLTDESVRDDLAFTDSASEYPGDEAITFADMLLADESVREDFTITETIASVVTDHTLGPGEGTAGAEAMEISDQVLDEELLVESAAFTDSIESDYTDTEDAALVTNAIEMLVFTEELEDQSERGIEESDSFTIAAVIEAADGGAEVSFEVVESMTVSDAVSINHRSAAITEGMSASAIVEQAGSVVNELVERVTISDWLASAVPQAVVESVVFSTAHASGLSSVLNQGMTASADAVQTIANLATDTIEAAHFTDVLVTGLSNTVTDNLSIVTGQEIASSLTNEVVESAVISNVATHVSMLANLVLEQLALSDEYATQLLASNELAERMYIVEVLLGGGAAGAWTSHLETFAMSRYENFPFQSMAVVDGVALGVGEDGLYQLDGDDDLGMPIAASVLHDWIDRVANEGRVEADPRRKRLRAFWIEGHTGGSMECTVGYVDQAGNDQTVGPFTMEMPAHGGDNNNRLILPFGPHSRFYQVRFGNHGGVDLSLGSAHLEVDPTHRRL